MKYLKKEPVEPEYEFTFKVNSLYEAINRISNEYAIKEIDLGELLVKTDRVVYMVNKFTNSSSPFKSSLELLLEDHKKKYGRK